MEYKIPKSTIRSFIDVLKDTKINLNAIKNNTNKEKEKISTQFLISDGALKNKEEEEEIIEQAVSEKEELTHHATGNPM